jgi:hypothetical protein
LLFKASKVATLDEVKLDASPQEWHPKNLFWRWHYGPSTSNFGANLKPAGHAHPATTHFDSTPSELMQIHHKTESESMQDGAISLA